MGTGGKIKLEEGTAGGTYVGFKAPDTEVTSELLWELPATDGTAGQVMATNGTKQLYWGNFAEATATANADSSLQSAINTEITNRAVADSSLQAALQANINAEATLRENADSSLQANINALTNTVFRSTAGPHLAVVETTIGCDTGTTAITITAPATPTQGQWFRIKDVGGNAAINNVTVARNSSNIAGVASDFTIDSSWIELTFTYYNATIGWAPTK